jgi:hypothetical protein
VVGTGVPAAHVPFIRQPQANLFCELVLNRLREEKIPVRDVATVPPGRAHGKP